MKLDFTPTKSLIVLIALGKISFSQVVFLPPNNGFGTLESQSSYQSNYNAVATLFLQSSGITAVTDNNRSGTAWINPASLGQPSERWAHGDAAVHTSPLSPELNLIGLRITDEEAVYQHGNTGVSLGERDYNFGPVGRDSTDSNGHAASIGPDGHEWNLSVGQRLNESGPVEHNVGISLKYALAPDGYADYGKSRNGYLLDLGYLGAFQNGFRIGLSVQNLGWGLHGVKPVTLRQEYTGATVVRQYYEEDRSFSLTPLTGIAGLGYQRVFMAQDVYILEAKASFAYSLECKQGGLNEYADYQAGGVELNWLNTFTSGYGLLRDSKVSANAFKQAYGINLFNHLSIGYAFLISSSVFYESQKSFSLEVYNLLSYRKKDWTWWKS